MWFRFFYRLVFLLVISVTLGVTYQKMHPAGILTRNDKVVEPSSGKLEEAPPVRTLVHEFVSASWSGGEQATLASVSAPAATSATAPDIPETTWDQAMEWMEKKQARLIDVRSRASFVAGHVPGADSFPIEELVGGMDGLLAKYPDSSQKLVFYCSNVRCPQAKEVARLLISRHQRKEVFFVPGGFFQWRAENSDANSR